MRALLTFAAVVVLTTPVWADDSGQAQQGFWQNVNSWFAPADVAPQPFADTNMALVDSIPPTLAGDVAVTGTAIAGNTPASLPRSSAFADPLMSPEDLSAIAPAAGPDMQDLSRGFEDPVLQAPAQ